MANCQKCEKKLPLITIKPTRHPNPLGSGHLCKACYQPYFLVLKTYTTNVKRAETDPKAAAWIALCCLLAAQRINLVHTMTAVLCGIVETKNSWEVCKQKSIEHAKKALSMLPSNSKGRPFVKALLQRAEALTEPPLREIPMQKYGSVFGDSIAAIEYEAIVRSSVSIDELNKFAKSLPGYRWSLFH